MGLTWEPTYEDYNEEDFRRLLLRSRLPHGQQDRLLRRIANERGRGIDELKRVMRLAKVQNALGQVVQAKNFRIFKALYLSEEVNSLAGDIFEELYSTWVDIEHGYKSPASGTPINVLTRLTVLGDRIQALGALMRQELQPRVLSERGFLESSQSSEAKLAKRPGDP